MPLTVPLPFKHGRPSVGVDIDRLWGQLYAIEALLRHLEPYRGWRAHLETVRVPEWVKGAVRTLRGARGGLLGNGRAIEVAGRLNGMKPRTIRRRIQEFYEYRGEWLYYVARPPSKPVVLGVGNVVTWGVEAGSSEQKAGGPA